MPDEGDGEEDEPELAEKKQGWRVCSPWTKVFVTAADTPPPGRQLQQ